MTKYIFVTGGVVSGLGKGITAASLGRLLKSRGLKIAAQKLDPYINVDPGTMSPFQHGEVYVTDDGAETDLDLGHYERFIDEDLNKFSNLTTGKVYWNVLNKERAGEYLGETVQVIPHITNEIKSFIYSVGKKTSADVVITEIGGTTGDIESQPFLEAIRQVAAEVGRRNCLFIHVTLVPFISGSNEPKSKPTQHSVKELRGLGISPDIIVARVDQPMDDDIKRKISMFCTVPEDCVIENRTLPVLYQAPMMLEESHLSDIVCRELSIGARGVEGMICAANYARTQGIPYFGICLGMQIAVMSYARNVLGYADANSSEFDPDSTHPVIDLMESQQGISKKGGTMRLGAYPCKIRPNTIMASAYGEEMISERHRHRYEFNNNFREEIENKGMQITGTSPTGELVETVEIPNHPFYIGVQFHPEFKSRPNRAHPLFKAFVAASLKRSQNNNAD